MLSLHNFDSLLVNFYTVYSLHLYKRGWKCISNLNGGETIYNILVKHGCELQNKIFGADPGEGIDMPTLHIDDFLERKSTV